MMGEKPRFVSAVLLTIVCLQQLKSANAAEVMFRRADYTVFESDLPVQFEVLLQPSALPDGDITIEIITVSGTATGGIDYDSSPVNVTFPAGDTSYRAFFEISIYNDNQAEGNESFSLEIVNSSLPEGVGLGRPHEAVVTINQGNGNPSRDVMFVIDTSGSIGRDNFQLIREFTANLTTELIRNSPRSAVGVILFASNAHIEFNLQAHTNLSELLTAIAGLPYSGGGTNTAEALRLLSSTAQNGTLGLRNNSSNTAIIITDGQSDNPLATSLAANELHNLNIFDVYAVGVDGADLDELNKIASSPELVFFTTDFSSTSLQQLKDRIVPQFNIDTLTVLATVISNMTRNVQELLPNDRVYLWPIQPVQKIIFECMSRDGNPEIYLSSLNQTSVSSQIEFSQFPTSLNGFLICRSNTTGEERRTYIANATVAGGIAVPLTPSPFTVMEGESAMLSFLIALVDRSLNVSSSVEVDHDFDGELPSANITNRNNDRYDVLFPPIAYGINIFIDFNRRSILAEPFQLDLQFLDVANVILQPEDQFILIGQNAFFHCRLNGTNGRLIPVQWSISVDGPPTDIIENSTEYLILPPANSGLVVLQPPFDRSVACRGGTRTYEAYLGVNRGSGNCSVDNNNCEHTCTQSECSCLNGQTLIQTSCLSQSVYFDIYREVYEDSDVFIHHPLYHPGPFEITCRSQDENAITEQGQWIIQAFNDSTTIDFNGSTVILNNSSITASASLTGQQPFVLASLLIDQPVEGYFTCIVNNISHTIRVLTGGNPLLELLTPEPFYITSSRFYTITVRAFIVNSFGKTVNASQSHLAVTVINGTDRSNASISSYILNLGVLNLVLPSNLDTRSEFGRSTINDTSIEITLTSAANFTTTISYSPVYAQVTNITLVGSQNILASEQLTLNCFTVPSDLPVSWVFVSDNILILEIKFFGGSLERQLAEDPRAHIESTEFGSRLTLTNTTVEDSGVYRCHFIQRDLFSSANIFVPVIPDPVSIGYNISDQFHIFPFIIPDGNVINHLPPQPRKRGVFDFTSTILSCYSISGHENPVWEIPKNSSFDPIISIISPYQSVLQIANIISANSVEKFVCRSSNNVSSSVIITNNPYFIQPLSPNPLVVKYLHPVSLSFQVAALSNGIDNRVRGIFLVRPGSREPLGISSTTSNSQVFTEELGPAVSQTSGNYTASFMFQNLFGNSTVEVNVKLPDLVANRTTINVLLGENVAMYCLPSDSSLQLQWVIITRTDSEIIPPVKVDVTIPPVTDDDGSAKIDDGSAELMIEDGGGNGFDDEGSAEIVIPLSDLARRLQYQLPLIHQLTLTNTTMSDSGSFFCRIKPQPNDNINISQEIVLNVLTNVISIGYSLDRLIPEHNAINLMEIHRREEGGFISCFTTQGHENPGWVISGNDFSSGSLTNSGTVTMVLGGVNVTIIINRISLYESEIFIDANGADFTSNLTCQSQTNPSISYTVIVTTRELYLQSLSPNPAVVRYLQPISLAFLVALNSDGISNTIEFLTVVQVDINGRGSIHEANELETSSQIFTIDLGNATEMIAGNYTISVFEHDDNIIIEVIVEIPTITTHSPNIGILSGENVTFECLSSDPNIELFWTYQTNRSSNTITIDNITETRFLSDSSLLHRLTLPSANVSDEGVYRCIAQQPFSSIATETIVLNVLPDVVNIGYSPDEIIPENNVINLRNTFRSRRLLPGSITCHTTQGHENPIWIVSNDDYSSGPLINTGAITVTLGGENITVVIIRRSLYQSDILINTNNVDFTGNLTCQSQNNSEARYTVIVTTSLFYVQTLTPIRITTNYSRPINLTFLAAGNSDGIVNGIEPPVVFQYNNPSGSPVGPRRPSQRLSVKSTQIFVLDLDRAGISTIGYYLIFNTVSSENRDNTTIGVIMVEVPALEAVRFDKEFLSGETVTFECMPSYLELYWTYETVNGSSTITTDNITESEFLNGSSLLHKLILPIANVSDTGNYTCVLRGPPGDHVISQTISLTVLPACGRLDRLSHGVLWPITETGETERIFCSTVNPSFGFGPYATRRCRDDATWSRVDTSQCNIRPMQQSTIVVSSIYVEVDEINAINMNSPEIIELRTLYENSSSLISTELTVLSDRLYVPNTRSLKKRQISSTRYSLLAPVIFTVNIMNRTTSAENVAEMIRSTDVFTIESEIIGFNSVDVCECSANSGELQESSVVDICIGVSGSPCMCNNLNCSCNEGYAGNGSLCARDTDRDTFPDVNLTCPLSTCLADKCPLIASTGTNDESLCQSLPNTTDHCPQDIDADYEIMWPPTIVNMDASNNCPGGDGKAVRSCGSNGQWATPVVENCTSFAFRTLMSLMEEVKNGTAELSHLTSNLALVTDRTENTSAYPADLMNANSLLQFSLDNIEQNPAILTDDDLVQDIADCFSNILSFDNNVGWMELEETNPGQSQMILMNSERFALLLAENIEIGSNRTVISDNIVIVAELVDAGNINDVTFPDPNSNISTNSSIFIPASYIQQRAMITSISRVPIVNIIYENIENILPSVNNRPVSQILSSQVTNTSNTSSDIAVQLTLQYSINENDSMLVCGFWNFSLNEGSGGWDTEGVSVISNDTNSSTITCNSTHLTSFAVLVDVSGGHEDISDTERTALSAVSYVGCGISIVCLVIAIIVLVYYRNTLLKGIHNFIHLNLAIALLLALIVFVSGIDTATDSEVACTIVAALLHYFFTAVFTWMLCEGIMLYFLLVKVFNTGVGQRKLFYLVLGWGIPIPIVAISVGIAHDEYGHEDFCWIDYDKGAIWGFVAPMLAIIIVNIVFLLLSLRSLYKSKRGKLTGEEASRAMIVKTVLKATVILLPLLGITWVFGILAVNQESSVFAWIFTILNSLQGMFILFFHVIRNEKIWQKILSCWRDDKYSFIPSSQRSSTASRGAKIKKNIEHTYTTTDPSSTNTMELKSKLDTSTFQESSGVDTESKSFGIEASVAETENEKPPITTDADANQEEEAVVKQEEEEEAVTTTTFSIDVTVPSSNETDL